MNNEGFKKNEKFILLLVIMVSWVLLSLELFINIDLSKDNQKLLVQVDQAMGDYNKIKTDYEILNGKYKQTLSENERLIELIRVSDKFEEVEWYMQTYFIFKLIEDYIIPIFLIFILFGVPLIYFSLINLKEKIDKWREKRRKQEEFRNKIKK